MNKEVLDAALFHHNEGLNCIPVVYRDKKPALPSWEEYHTRISTKDEIYKWFGNGHSYNLGLVHCKLKNGLTYAAVDIDHDTGICDELFNNFYCLFKGRIEQSGSGEGFHIPILADIVPNWNNKTWKTDKGNVNLRIAASQTLCPPSVHPTGGLYRYVQTGPITRIHSFDSLIEWLNTVSPFQPKQAREIKRAAIQSPTGDDLLSAVRAAWPTCLSVFAHFGMADRVEQERNDELRLLGHGGLLLTADGSQWFAFEQERGGGIFEAWWFARFGALPYDKRANFRQVLLEMAAAAGIDAAQFYRRGDEQKIEPVKSKRIWTAQYGNMWERVR